MNIDLLDIMSHGFMQRAFIAGFFTALVCSILGVFLVLRRFSLIGDGLAHVTFGSVAIGLALGVYPLAISIPVVMASSLGLLKLSERARLFGDTAIGIVSSLGIAGGVLLASLSGGFNVDLFSYLFGNILAVSTAEVFLSIGLSLVVILVVLFFYHDMFAATFDPESAQVAGIRTDRISAVLILLTAVTVVLAMKVVGIMLISAFLILPAVTALQVAKSFRTAILASVVTAELALIAGLVVSYLLDTPTGATVVMISFFFFLLALLYRKTRR